MADLDTLITVKPETISALNDTIKIVIGAIGSLSVVIGTWITILSKRTERAAKENTKETAVNTEALAIHTKDMVDLKNQVITRIETFTNDLGQIQNELSKELNNVKVVVAKVSNHADAKLSMIPKIQDQLTKIEKQGLETAFKAGQVETRVESMIAVITKKKGTP